LEEEMKEINNTDSILSIETSEPDIHQRIIFLKKGIEKQFLKLGAYLSLVNDNKLYQEKGYDTFESYIAMPELSMERRTVYAIMGVYKDFKELDDCNQSHIEIEDIGYAKLDRIRQFRKEENFTEWVEKARTLSLSDPNTEIREAKGEPEKVYNPKSRMVTLTCPHCGKSFGYTIKD
jgi:hypothetical protein